MENVDGVETVQHRYSQADGFSTFLVVAAPEAEPRAQLAAAVVSGGWGLLRLQSIGMSLEEIFLRVTTDEAIPDPEDGEEVEAD